jgi:hypothetical protein
MKRSSVSRSGCQAMSAAIAVRPVQTHGVWCGQPDDPTTIQTTLYDLITALHDAVEPGEEALVVTAMMHLLQAGRIKRPVTRMPRHGSS